MLQHLEFSRAAQKDIKTLRKAGRGDQIKTAIDEVLVPSRLPQNANVKALVGLDPWLRLRSGSYRVIFRELTPEELTKLGKRHSKKIRSGWLIHRVIHRKDLHAVAEKLGLIVQEQVSLKIKRTRKR